MEVKAEGRVVIPGESLVQLPENGRLRIGLGMYVEENHIISGKCGIARQTKAGKIWIEGRQKRYIPAVGDSVLGVVTERYGESWSVDICGPFDAILDALAFEGVTKRSRPNLIPGDLIYARVTEAPRDADPTIVCVDASGKAAGYGPLKEGYKVECSTGLARKLLGNPTAPVLSELGATVKYEIAIGLNGRLWIKSENVVTTILVTNAITNSEFLQPGQAKMMVRRLASFTTAKNA